MEIIILGDTFSIFLLELEIYSQTNSKTSSTNRLDFILLIMKYITGKIV